MKMDCIVKIPKSKGKIVCQKGYVYFEYGREYKPDKKYNIPKRTTIGKKCDDDPEMMYPNPSFLTYFPDAEIPKDQGRDDRSSCLRIGTFLVIEKIIISAEHITHRQLNYAGLPMDIHPRHFRQTTG